MKILLGLLATVTLTFVGCITNTTGTNDPGNETCVGGNNCVCPSNIGCDHTCSSGAAECHVQGGSAPVDVECNNNLECHVECAAATSCNVDCGGSAECHVTCPPSGCTVTDCVGSACVVSCGFGSATRSGSTATCP